MDSKGKKDAAVKKTGNGPHRHRVPDASAAASPSRRTRGWARSRGSRTTTGMGPRTRPHRTLKSNNTAVRYTG